MTSLGSVVHICFLVASSSSVSLYINKHLVFANRHLLIKRTRCLLIYKDTDDDDDDTTKKQIWTTDPDEATKIGCWFVGMLVVTF